MSAKLNLIGGKAAYSIRLASRGCRNRSVFHIVVNSSSEENNKVKAIEELGIYDPLPNANNEILVGLNVERFKYWMTKDNVKITAAVGKLLGICGVLPVHPLSYIEARNNNKNKKNAEGVGETNS